MKVLSTEGVVNLADRLRICADIEEARMEGYKVECRRNDLQNNRWDHAPKPSYSILSFDYRAKREPRTLYAVYSRAGAFLIAEDSLSTAEMRERNSPGRTIAKFIEVIEE